MFEVEVYDRYGVIARTKAASVEAAVHSVPRKWETALILKLYSKDVAHVLMRVPGNKWVDMAASADYQIGQDVTTPVIKAFTSVTQPTK
jgi:hypothetical protein